MFPIASVKEHPNVKLLELSLASVLSPTPGEIVLRMENQVNQDIQMSKLSIQASTGDIRHG